MRPGLPGFRIVGLGDAAVRATLDGFELARKANLTLVGRARGKRFVALAGEDRIVFDQDLAYVEEESAKHRRKAAVHDD